jgi:hypothetical protein
MKAQNFISILGLVLLVCAIELSPVSTQYVNEYIRVTGVVQEGGTTIEWTDKYADQSSSEFLTLQEQLGTSLKEILSPNFTDALGSCVLENIDKDTLVAQVKVEFNGQKFDELGANAETVQDVLESYEQKTSANASLGTIESVLSLSPTETITLVGVLYENNKTLQWVDEYADQTSSAFQKLEYNSCSTLSLAFSSKYTSRMKSCALKNINESNSVATTEIVVRQLQEYEPNPFNLSETCYVSAMLDLYAYDNLDAIRYGDIQAIESAVTGTEAVETLVMTGVLYEKGVILTWVEDYSNTSSEAFLKLQETFCEKMQKAFESKYADAWKSCSITSIDKYTLEAKSKVEFDEILLQRAGGSLTTLNETIQEFMKNQSESVFFEELNEIEIPTLELETLKITGLLYEDSKQITWACSSNTDQWDASSENLKQHRRKVCNNLKNAFSRKYGSIFVSCSNMKMKCQSGEGEINVRFNKALLKSFGITEEMLRAELEAYAVDYPSFLIFQDVYNFSVVSMASTVFTVENVNVTWKDEYKNVSSAEYLALQSELCAKLKEALKEKYSEAWKRCEIASIESTTGSASVNVEFFETEFASTGSTSATLQKEIQEYFAKNNDTGFFTDNTTVDRDLSEAESFEVVKITGSMMKNGQVIEWNKNYLDQTSSEFLLLQKEFCENVQAALLSKFGRAWKHCSIRSVDPLTMQVESNVEFIQSEWTAVQGSEELLKTELQKYGETHVSKLFFSQDVTVETVDETELDVAVWKYVVFVYDGKEKLKWDAEYDNHNSEKFKNLRTTFCKNVKSALEAKYLKAWRSCDLSSIHTGTGIGEFNLELLKSEVDSLMITRDSVKAEMISYSEQYTSQLRIEEVISSESITKEEMDYYTFRTDGVVYMGGKVLTWDQDYADTSSAKFKEVEKNICKNLKAAFKEKHEKAWRSCSVTSIDPTTLKAETNIGMLQGEWLSSDVSVEYLKKELEAYLTTHENELCIHDVTSFQNISTEVTSIDIIGSVYEKQESITWEEDYADQSSVKFFALQKKLCDCMLKELPDNLRKATKDCSISKMESGTSIATTQLKFLKYDFEAANASVESVQKIFVNVSKVGISEFGIGEVVDVETEDTDYRYVMLKGKVNSYLQWTENYKDKNTQEFNELQFMMCDNVKKALASKFPNVFKKCGLESASQSEKEVELKVEYNEEQLTRVEGTTESMKAAVISYASEHNEQVNFEKTTTITMTEDISTVTIQSVTISGTVYKYGQKLNWRKEYSNQTSPHAKELQFMLCNNLKKGFKKGFPKAWKGCSLSRARSGSVIADTTIDYNSAATTASSDDVMNYLKSYLESNKNNSELSTSLGSGAFAVRLSTSIILLIASTLMYLLLN